MPASGIFVAFVNIAWNVLLPFFWDCILHAWEAEGKGDDRNFKASTDDQLASIDAKPRDRS